MLGHQHNRETLTLAQFKTKKKRTQHTNTLEQKNTIWWVLARATRKEWNTKQDETAATTTTTVFNDGKRPLKSLNYSVYIQSSMVWKWIKTQQQLNPTEKTLLQWSYVYEEKSVQQHKNVKHDGDCCYLFILLLLLLSLLLSGCRLVFFAVYFNSSPSSKISFDHTFFIIFSLFVSQFGSNPLFVHIYTWLWMCGCVLVNFFLFIY